MTGESIWQWTPEYDAAAARIMAASGSLPALVWAEQVKPDLVELQVRSGIPAAGAVTQLLHEAWQPGGLVLSRLGSEFNNFAGLKWAPDGWQREFGGRPVSMTTWEEVDGSAETVEDAFCAFPSWTQFLAAYERLLTWPRYAGALVYAQQPLLWLHQVWAAGYATDSRYLIGPGRWLAAAWPDYQDTLPVPPRRPVAVLDAAGSRLCEGWLADPDGPGPEPHRTVVRLKELADAMGLVIEYDPGGPAAYLRWSGARV